MRHCIKGQVFYPAFSLLPLICLACISLPVIYKNQVGKIQDEVYEELQNRVDDMNYEDEYHRING